MRCSEAAGGRPGREDGFMVITELYIRNFGKISDRHIYLRDGIQVVSGENEFGKTTMHAFIRAMLFGLERGRGRAAANDDFSRYEPWGSPGVYGGVMRFECGGRRFRLEREFARGARRGSLVCEDDGEELSIGDGDLEMLLGGLTAEVFDSTVSVGQLRAEPGRCLSDALTDYAVDYYETGGGAFNVADALQVLNDRRRTAERELRAEIEAAQEAQKDIRREIHYLERDAERLEQEYAQKERMPETPGGPEDRTRRGGAGMKRRAKAATWVAMMCAGLAAAALCAVGIAGASAPVPAAAGGLSGLALSAAGLYLLVRDIRRRRSAGAEEKDVRLEGELAHIRAEYQDKAVRCGNLREQLEEWEKSGRQIRLEERCRALSVASEQLREAAQDTGRAMKRRISGRMSEIFAAVTGCRYRSVEAGRAGKGFHITVWDGERRIPAENLSRGTLEQIYFSLRMAAAELLLEEPFPVILDDVFAFYDDKRLEAVLQWLGREKRQVILFTCHSREERILKNMY